MRLASTISSFVIALLPLAAGAVDVKLGVETVAVYDTNVFREGSDEKDDGSFRFSPSISIENQDGKLGVDIFYKPTYEVFTTYTDASGLTHYLKNHITYAPSEKTNLELTNIFRKLDLLNFDDPDTVDEGTIPIPDNDIERDEMIIYNAAFNLSHAFTPRLSSDTDLAFSLFDTDRRNSVDNRTVSAFQSFSYAINAANTVGGGGGVVVQMFDKVNTLPESNTFIYRLFGSFVRKFGESTTLSIRAGPAFITTDQENASGSGNPTYPFLEFNSPGVAPGSLKVPDADTCLVAPAPPYLFEGNKCALNRVLRSDHPEDLGLAPNDFAGLANAFDQIRMLSTDTVIAGSSKGSDDSTFAIFGEVTLTHRWMPTLVSTLSYNRNQNTASGQGTSTIADTVSFFTGWQATERWDLSMRATYIKRESATDLSRTFAQVDRDISLAPIGLVMLTGDATVVEESTSVDTQRWSVYLRAARRLTRHTTLSANFAYSDQTSKHTSRSPNDFGDFRVLVGFKYDFEPFRF